MIVEQWDYYLEKVNKKDFLYSDISAKIHGFILDNIPASIATELHNSAMNPFSLFVYDAGTYWILRVSVFNETAKAITAMLNSIGYITIFTQKPTRLEIYKKENRISATWQELWDADIPKSMVVSFMTPTSFKTGAYYTPLFLLASFLQSLQKKVSLFSDVSISKEELPAIKDALQIQEYTFHTQSFLSDKNKIPAFVGKIRFSLVGTKEVNQKCAFLLRLASVFGVGVKTGMGMGGCIVQ